MDLTEKELIKYIKSFGIDVHTSTKARGHQGFFLKNRIDISKNLPSQRVIPTLMHEFAHYVHYGMEPDMHKTGGSFKILFGEVNPVFEAELVRVTNLVDENSLCKKLYYHKSLIKEKIKEYEKEIKKDYPKFMRSKKFKEFDKYIRKSRARYLLKYDRVKLIGGFWGNKTEIYSVENVERDFDMPHAFAAYIRLKSYQRKQSRVSARINRLKKYYTKPSELFARFVEGLYLYPDKIEQIAPYTYDCFLRRLDEGHYKELSTLFRTCLRNG